MSKRYEIENIRQHPLYSRWVSMMSRCYNPSEKAYVNYGARGISVCEEWRSSYKCIMGLMALEGYDDPDKTTLDRIDNDKGYSPENCRWANRSTQCHNRREFQNNTSGCTGVKRVKGKMKGWKAVIDDKYIRYDLGTFDKKSQAIFARTTFEALYKLDKQVAIKWLSENRPNVRRNSQTGVTGISIQKGKTENCKTGYMVRYYHPETQRRTYIGHYTDFEKAVLALENFKMEKNLK